MRAGIEADQEHGRKLVLLARAAEVNWAVAETLGDEELEARLYRPVAAFRALPVPVIGRIEDGQLRPDLRCFEDEGAFVEQLPTLGH